MSDLDAELWSELNPVLVKNVLSFLSVPVLCRFRVVCKDWDSYIRTPSFGARCIQHTRRDAQFIVVREVQGWGLLDVSERRWYRIKHNDPDVYGWFKIVMVAMDGGLVCHYLGEYAHRIDDVSVFVSNPLARTSRRLPPCALLVASVMPHLFAVVDNITHAFKIFVMPSSRDRADDSDGDDPELMVIFESTTNRWRQTSFPHLPPRGLHRCNEESSVVLDGSLYVLVRSSSISEYERYMLWSYDHDEDSWTNNITYVKFPIGSDPDVGDTSRMINITHVKTPHLRSDSSVRLRLLRPQLVVSDSRLFLASWIERRNLHVLNQIWGGKGFGCSQDGWSYEVHEVHLDDKSLTAVFIMTRAALNQLGLADYSGGDLEAIGCSKSIVFVCLHSRRSITYDLNTSSWEPLPAFPVVPVYGWNMLTRMYRYRSMSMNLMLPQWDPQHETE